MSRIRGKDTKPEISIRKALFSRGFRYRLHDKALPGKPDIVFPRYKAVIFVHGCFWHGHDCHLFKWPTSNESFWREKISRNREVDSNALECLDRLGWRVLTVWECALKGKKKIDITEIAESISEWLSSNNNFWEIKG